MKAFSWQARNEAASKLDLSVKQTDLEIEKLQTEKQKLISSIDVFRSQQIDLQSEIDSIQEDFYSSGANLSKSEQQLVFLKDKKNQLVIELETQKENQESLLETKISLTKKIDNLNADLKEKEPKLEKMDASISKLDGAMSPVFILKQIIIEQASLKNSLEDFKLNFDSKSMQDLEPIINNLKKFEDKLSKLNEILEKQEDYQEEKFLTQKNDLLQLSGEITNLKVNIATISRDIASLDEQEKLSKETFDSNTKQLKEIEQPISELEKDMKPLLDSRANVEDDLTNRRTKYAEISEEIRQSERRSHEVDISIEKIRTDSQDSKVTRQGYLSEAEIYLKQLEKDNFILEDLLKELSNDETEENLINEISKIESSISRIGPINLAASEEYKIEEERKLEIDAQSAELEKALTTLQNAIKKIDLESKTKFKDTLDQLNIKVGELFPKLFGGGHASLELTSEDLLESGVFFKAMPPGKKNVNVSQLSGGEKALSAIALVFSFFALNPAPFCILDEIDAPLDDFNTARFISMVEEMSDKVQFIFVTHNKISMEKSKHLFGVTMQEPGVSRLVSVDVDEAMKMAAV